MRKARDHHGPLARDLLGPVRDHNRQVQEARSARGSLRVCREADHHVRIVQGLLGRVRDHNRQVQEAACSALATLEEAAGGVLVPRLPAILDTLAGAVLAYSRRNLRLLYDSLSTLADAVGPALAEVGRPRPLCRLRVAVPHEVAA